MYGTAQSDNQSSIKAEDSWKTTSIIHSLVKSDTLLETRMLPAPVFIMIKLKFVGKSILYSLGGVMKNVITSLPLPAGI